MDWTWRVIVLKIDGTYLPIKTFSLFVFTVRLSVNALANLVCLGSRHLLALCTCTINNSDHVGNVGRMVDSHSCARSMDFAQLTPVNLKTDVTLKLILLLPRQVPNWSDQILCLTMVWLWGLWSIFLAVMGFWSKNTLVLQTIPVANLNIWAVCCEHTCEMGYAWETTTCPLHFSSVLFDGHCIVAQVHRILAVQTCRAGTPRRNTPVRWEELVFSFLGITPPEYSCYFSSKLHFAGRINTSASKSLISVLVV